MEQSDQPRGPPVVVIAASSGGVEALVKVVAGLDDDLGAAMVVVLHLPATGKSVLPDILRRAGPLPVSSAANNAPIRPNCITVAPPDHHVLVDDGHLVLDRGPRENGSRPAADPLFRSAAKAHGARTIGIVLSGALDDGVAGLRAIKEAGGIAVVQDPNDALTPSMPATALAHVPVDHVVPADAIPALLARLVHQVSEERLTLAAPDNSSSNHTPHGPSAMPGESTLFTCPECGGVVWQQHEGALTRFACHVGHSYSVESMLEYQSDSVETALWTALRVLEERLEFLRHLAEHQRERGNDYTARGFERRADEVMGRAAILRDAIGRAERPHVDEPVVAP